MKGGFQFYDLLKLILLSQNQQLLIFMFLQPQQTQLSQPFPEDPNQFQLENAEPHLAQHHEVMRVKWSVSQISESTNYQTHSQNNNHFPDRNVWSSVKVKMPVCSSNSPEVAKKRNEYSKQFIITHTTPFYRMQPIQMQSVSFSPEKIRFRSRIVSNGLTTPPNHSLGQFLDHVSATSYIAVFTDGNGAAASWNCDERRQIASLTKIMTAYTVIQICHEFGIKIREHYIPVLNKASYMEGTSANLRSGEEILIIDLLYGLLLPSGNDAGIALAQYFGKFLSFKFARDNSLNEHNTSNLEKFNECKKYYDSQYERGSIRLFVFQMNKYAHKLKLTNTKFVNPTGLTNVENYSTARDLAVLTSVCLKDHVMRLIFKRKVHKCEVKNEKLGYNREVIWKNTNKLLYKYKECIGVKTGLTPGAGPCLSSAYRIGSKELVIIVLNCSGSEQRFEDSQKIYKWCRRKFIPQF